MKKLPIIALVCIATAVLIFMNAADELSTYVTISEAESTTSTVKVVGELVKNKPIEYNPEIDPNYFSFFLRDEDQRETKIILNGAKPQDFEMSEQIVVTGRMQDEYFAASDMLTKCPSKYKDEEIAIKGKS